MWIWVLTFTILGINPQNGQEARFKTKQDCLNALALKKQEAIQQGKEIIGTCYLIKKISKENNVDFRMAT